MADVDAALERRFSTFLSDSGERTYIIEREAAVTPPPEKRQSRKFRDSCSRNANDNQPSEAARQTKERGLKPSPTMPESNTCDFSRLNEAERRALRLLAEGHTAKSIAAVTGSSPTAVNERLREARRKTGVGSSRELARLLKAQESCAEKIDLAAPASGDAETSTPARHKGVIVMTLFLATGTAAALLMSGGFPTEPSLPPQAGFSSQAPVEDPLIGGPMPPGVNPERLHTLVRSEERDVAWATAKEAELKSIYGRIPHLSGPGGALRVTCARSLCEVAGLIDLPEPPSEESQEAKDLNKVMKALQSDPLHTEVPKLGLESAGGLFTSSKSTPRKSIFFSYWLRAKS